MAFGDAGYTGRARPRATREDLQWHIAARPSDSAKLPDGRSKARLREGSSISRRRCAPTVEHAFRVIKRQFG